MIYITLNIGWLLQLWPIVYWELEPPYSYWVFVIIGLWVWFAASIKCNPFTICLLFSLLSNFDADAVIRLFGEKTAKLGLCKMYDTFQDQTLNKHFFYVSIQCGFLSFISIYGFWLGPCFSTVKNSNCITWCALWTVCQLHCIWDLLFRHPSNFVSTARKCE